MTIITKPLSEKKGDKLVVPLVENEVLPPTAPADDLESQNRNFVILRARARRVSTTTTLCLLLTALLIVGVGIIGGTYLYRQYLRAEVHRIRGWANIPYSDNQEAMALNDDTEVNGYHMGATDFDQLMQNIPNTLPEEIEIDDNYEKISVPDFRDGRAGRFIHDFNTNMTGIIDVTGDRCFVMPLNRGNVLPPKSLFDLIQKMWEGYYKVDTSEVRQTMRVVLPPLTDTKDIGSYIAKECEGRDIYKLEKYVDGVVKRSADHKKAQFAQFAGKGLQKIEIVNFEELEEYEKEHRNQ